MMRVRVAAAAAGMAVVLSGCGYAGQAVDNAKAAVDTVRGAASTAGDAVAAGGALADLCTHDWSGAALAGRAGRAEANAAAQRSLDAVRALPSFPGQEALTGRLTGLTRALGDSSTRPGVLRKQISAACSLSPQ